MVYFGAHLLHRCSNGLFDINNEGQEANDEQHEIIAIQYVANWIFHCFKIVSLLFCFENIIIFPYFKMNGQLLQPCRTHTLVMPVAIGCFLGLRSSLWHYWSIDLTMYIASIIKL